MKQIVFALVLSLFVSHADSLGVVKKIEGQAKLQPKDSMRKSSLSVGDSLQAGATVLTYRNSKVVIELRDKTALVLDAYAQLTLLTADSFDQKGGKVYYKVTSRKGAQGLKVNTPFAIIGVKGTEFVITDTNESQELALNSGLVGVDSPDDKPFMRIDEDKVNAALGGSPEAVMAEFEAYKKELYAQFAEYVTSFDLNPGKKLVFSGKQVLESTQGSSDQEQFEHFMSDAQFNEIANMLDKDVTGTAQTPSEAFDDDFFINEP